jgi:hypothetical protein
MAASGATSVSAARAQPAYRAPAPVAAAAPVARATGPALRAAEAAAIAPPPGPVAPSLVVGFATVESELDSDVSNQVEALAEAKPDARYLVIGYGLITDPDGVGTGQRLAALVAAALADDGVAASAITTRGDLDPTGNRRVEIFAQ